jgi:membrane protease subunit HflC
MKNKLILTIGLVLVALVVTVSGTFIVDETEQVVLTQFGRPIGEAITLPGVYFKIPFVQKSHFFEKRYLEWDGAKASVITQENQSIFVDSYARWQITDPLQFFKRLTNEKGAQSRLDDILDGETNLHVAKNKLIELVRSSNRTPVQVDTVDAELKDSLVPIAIGRAQIQHDILASANKQANDLGIKILDFRFKRVNYVQDVRSSVYDRMRSERNNMAEKFKSRGQGQASKINGEKDRELKTIQSGARRKAEEIKGDADAKAAAIYAAAYNRSAQSRELYAFLKSMETFDKTFDDETSVILSTDSELFKYLKKMK